MEHQLANPGERGKVPSADNDRSAAPGRRGFTLIEMLVVIAIIGVIAAVSLGVYVEQLRRAHQSSTRANIQILNDSLQDRLASFHGQPAFTAGIGDTDLGTGAVSGGSPTTELAVIQNQRVALLAKLSAMRGDFPQQFIDFLRAPEPPSGVSGSTHPGDGTTAATRGLGDWSVSSRARSAIYLDYLGKTVSQESLARNAANPFQVSSQFPFDPRNPPGYTANSGYSAVPLNMQTMQPHDPNTESSECLYLILTTANVDGVAFDPGAIEPRFIQDTDHDGLKEFVDSWGNPLRFYRWPTDYLEYLAKVNAGLPAGMANVNTLDPNGLLTRTEWFGHSGVRNAFEVGVSPANPAYGGFFRLHVLYRNVPSVNLGMDETDLTASLAYATSPIIVSAGPDGAGRGRVDAWQAFGLAWPSNGSTPVAGNLSARCARVGGTTDTAGVFTPDLNMVEAAGDNIISLLIRSGQEN